MEFEFCTIGKAILFVYKSLCPAWTSLFEKKFMSECLWIVLKASVWRDVVQQRLNCPLSWLIRFSFKRSSRLWTFFVVTKYLGISFLVFVERDQNIWTIYKACVLVEVPLNFLIFKYVWIHTLWIYIKIYIAWHWINI